MFFVPSQICGFTVNLNCLHNIFMIRIKVAFQFTVITALLLGTAEAQKSIYKTYKIASAEKKGGIITGADQTELYIDYLKGKNIGMVINQTSVIGKNLTLSVDTLLKLGITVKKIFGPEHGFRGDASNGATVNNGSDPATGLPVISLYGNKHYKPTPDDLKGLTW